MHPDYLRLLYAYHRWANARILDTTARLSPEQLQTPGSASFGTIHATLVHTMSAQWVWLERWRGHTATQFAAKDYADLAAIRVRWAEIEGESQAFVASLSGDGPARIVTYTNSRGQGFSFPLWQLMLHVITHGAQHRSEVAAMLTAFGHSPGDLDLMIYLIAQPPT